LLNTWIRVPFDNQGVTFGGTAVELVAILLIRCRQ
jgi:hypothetical protein